MTIFSQNDHRWSRTVFGGHYTIGRWGCTLTNLNMIRDWFYNMAWTPADTASRLKYDRGMVIWSSLSNIGLKLISRIKKRDDAAIRGALAAPNQCVIIEVNGSHWLWVIGRQLPVLGYKVVDPWDGRTKYTNAYRNNITGLAIVGRG